MRQNRKLLALLVVLILLAGCGGQLGQTNQQPSARELAWKSLVTGKMTYDATFTMLGQLDKQGKLNPAAKTQAIKLGNAYTVAHNRAVDDLLAGKEPTGMAGVEAALAGFLSYAATVKQGVK